MELGQRSGVHRPAEVLLWHTVFEGTDHSDVFRYRRGIPTMEITQLVYPE